MANDSWEARRARLMRDLDDPAVCEWGTATVQEADLRAALERIASAEDVLRGIASFNPGPRCPCRACASARAAQAWLAAAPPEQG